MRYEVIRDTREKYGWTFEESSNCIGTITEGLITGDYTLKGYEDLLCIERKGTLSEFSTNITAARFEREMDRLECYKHSFLILEFTMDTVMSFPANSGIPERLWPKLQVSKWFILKRITDFQLKYSTKIIFAGTYGKETAGSIFKRIVETYGKTKA